MEKEIISNNVKLESFAVGEVIYITGTAEKSGARVDVPEEIDGKPVVRLLERAFADCVNIVSLALPESIKEIGPRAFENCSSLVGMTMPKDAADVEAGIFTGCSSLKRVILPDALTKLPDGTFTDCTSLEGITLPKGMTSIGKEAFLRCATLQSFTSPEGVTEVKDNAFTGCRGLKVVSVPKGIKTIGAKAFSGCASLENIIFGGTKEMWAAVKKARGWRDGCPETTVICKDGNIHLKKTADFGAEASRAAKALGKGAAGVGRAIGSVGGALFGDSDKTRVTLTVFARIISVLAMIGTILNAVFIHTMDASYDTTFYILCAVFGFIGVITAIVERRSINKIQISLVDKVLAFSVLNVLSAGICGVSALLKLFHTIGFMGVWGITSACLIMFAVICLMIALGNENFFNNYRIRDDYFGVVWGIASIVLNGLAITNIVLLCVLPESYDLTFYIVSGALAAFALTIVFLVRSGDCDYYWEGIVSGVSILIAGMGALVKLSIIIGPWFLVIDIIGFFILILPAAFAAEGYNF